MLDNLLFEINADKVVLQLEALVHFFWEQGVSTTNYQHIAFLIFDSLFKVIVDFFKGSVPFEALLGLLVLEELAPVVGLLESLVILG